VREGLETLVGRIPRAHPCAELEAGLGDTWVVPQDLDGLGHRTELPGHAFTEFARELRLGNAQRHAVLYGRLLVRHEDTAERANVTTRG
jgi:hypothetical protein